VTLTLLLILIWILTLTENEGFSPEFIYEAPKGLRLKKNLNLKILTLILMILNLKPLNLKNPVK
jgi:hypothetical protein